MILTRLSAVLLVGVALTGCTSEPEEPSGRDDPPAVQLGAPGEDGSTLSPGATGSLEGPGYTDADVAFVQQMVPHHRQALEMTALVDERSADDGLPLMARRIEVAQTAEIAQLEGWLTDRDESLPDEHAHHGQHTLMPGMLTPGELGRLAAAEGRRFDRLFLQYMIRHHEGAVVMVEQLLTEGLGGQESHVFQLAQHIEVDQQVEIARMKRMLARLPE